MTDTTNTKTEAVTHADSFTVPTGMVTGGGITGAVGTLIFIVLAFRKRISRDNLELTKDRAETNLIQTYQETIKNLQEQNNKLDANAREAWRTRAEDAKRIGELSSKVEHLTDINESLQKNVDKMQTRIEDLVSLLRTLVPHEEAVHLIVHGNQQSVLPSPEN